MKIYVFIDKDKEILCFNSASSLSVSDLDEMLNEKFVVDNSLHLSWLLVTLLLDNDCLDEQDDNHALESQFPIWLSEDDCDTLLSLMRKSDLPSKTDLKLFLSNTGSPGKENYGLSTKWYQADGKVLAQQPVVVDGVLSHKGEKYRLSFGQLKLLADINEIRGLGQNRNRDYLVTGRVMAWARYSGSGISLHPALINQQIVHLDSVTPRLSADEDGYRLTPSIPDIEQKDVDDYYFDTPKNDLGEKLLLSKKDGKKTRVIFSERAQAALQETREKNVLTDDEAAEALSHPEEFFGDNFDLSGFAERVTGFGPDVRRVAPIVKELSEGSAWWDWDVELQTESVDFDETVDTKEAAKNVSLKDPEVLAQYKAGIERADEKNRGYMPDPAGGGMIEVSPQLRAAVEAAETLNDASEDGKLNKSPREVLQVKENLESLNFDQSTSFKPKIQQDYPQPRNLAADIKLLPHQYEGYCWLRSLYESRDGDGTRVQGALLADDMGLGKTIQVLSLISALQDSGVKGPHLIVAPAGLLENWQQEANKFFGISLEPIHQVIGRNLPKDPEVAAARLSSQFIVLASYDGLRRNETILSKPPWNLVVLDEAQKAKEPASRVHKSVRCLRSRFRLAATGTPVENTLKELWSVYDWAVPGTLGTLREFAKKYIKPLASGDDAMRVELSKQLRSEISACYLRRMKADVLKDLPPINWMNHRVSLSAEQEALYSQCQSERTNEKGSSLKTLQRLFSVLAHPELHQCEGALPVVSDVTFPKVEKLFEILAEIHARNEKVLIFANRKKIQRWLMDEIEVRFNVPVPLINGDVTGSKKRMRIIDDFSNVDGFAALVLAPRAAGMGLNITAANHVIHYTREWNPAIENQATDRAYRYKQTKPVTVYTITTTAAKGTTVEETLNELLEKKRQLMGDFVVPMGGFEVKWNDFDV